MRSEGSECRLCVCFLGFLCSLPCCWKNSFWKPTKILLQLKLKQIFLFKLIFIPRAHRTGGEVEFLPAPVCFLKTLPWAGLLHTSSVWNSVVRIVTESGFRARWYFHGFCSRPKPGWCHGLGSVLYWTLWSKYLISGISGLPSPACRSVFLFECVAEHDLDILGGDFVDVYFLWSMCKTSSLGH